MAPEKRPRDLRIVIFVFLGLAVVILIADAINGRWDQFASMLFFILGLLAYRQWQQYDSRRWRTIAWIFFSLAVITYILRFTYWANGSIE
jgi:predicted membrane channel-forming protein YqfA (hemolysin III family)